MTKLFFASLSVWCMLLMGGVAHADSSSAPSYVAVETNSGKLLSSQNAEAERPIGGLSQIATVMVTLDWRRFTGESLDTMLTVPGDAMGIVAGNPMQLQPGDRLTMRDAIYSSLMGSDNVSALTLAAHVGMDLARRQNGGRPIELFIAEMNKLAQALTMRNTEFYTPMGLESRKGVTKSTAVDMTLLSIYATRNAEFCLFAGQKQRQITVHRMASGSTSYNIINSNEMVVNQPRVDGVKAATSQLAGPCLVVSVSRDSVKRPIPGSHASTFYPQHMIVVVLGTPQRYQLAQAIINRGWAAWEQWQLAGMQNKDSREFLNLPQAQQPKK